MKYIGLIILEFKNEKNNFISWRVEFREKAQFSWSDFCISCVDLSSREKKGKKENGTLQAQVSIQQQPPVGQGRRWNQPPCCKPLDGLSRLLIVCPCDDSRSWIPDDSGPRSSPQFFKVPLFQGWNQSPKLRIPQDSRPRSSPQFFKVPLFQGWNQTPSWKKTAILKMSILDLAHVDSLHSVHQFFRTRHQRQAFSDMPSLQQTHFLGGDCRTPKWVCRCNLSCLDLVRAIWRRLHLGYSLLIEKVQKQAGRRDDGPVQKIKVPYGQPLHLLRQDGLLPVEDLVQEERSFHDPTS